MRTIHKLFRVDKSKIGFLKFIFEAYEGIAVITTIESKADPKEKGVVRFAIAPGCVEEVEAVLKDLKKDIYIDEL